MRLSISLVFITVFLGCEPCTDCSSDTRPPAIEASLFDTDRLLEVQDSLDLFDLIEIDTDSMLIYGDSITNFGKPYELKKLEFEAKIDAATNLRIGKEDSVFAEARDSVETLLTKNKGYLNNGRIAIDLLRIDQTGFSESYDSVNKHYLPLILNDEKTTLDILIDDEDFIINVVYTLSDELDADNRVIRSAFIESLTQSGMDSLLCYCEGIEEEIPCTSFNCDSQSSSISCYF